MDNCWLPIMPWYFFVLNQGWEMTYLGARCVPPSLSSAFTILPRSCPLPWSHPSLVLCVILFGGWLEFVLELWQFILLIRMVDRNLWLQVQTSEFCVSVAYWTKASQICLHLAPPTLVTCSANHWPVNPTRILNDAMVLNIWTALCSKSRCYTISHNISPQILDSGKGNQNVHDARTFPLWVKITKFRGFLI